MTMKQLMTIACCLALLLKTQAQDFTNRGTDFWAGFGHHSNMEVEYPFPDEFPQLVLYFSAEQPAHVVVTVEGTIYREEYDVPANSVLRSKNIPTGLLGPTQSPYLDARLYTKPSSYGGTNSEGIFKKKGIHIQSDVPIVAYAHEYAMASSSASMLIPTESWGYAYRALTVKQRINGTLNEIPRFSWIFVIASENNTRVRIVPTAPTRSGLPANTPIEVTLQKGEIYQLLSGFRSVSDVYDLNGTTIQSIANDQGECHPVAAFTGSSGLYISCGESGPSSGSHFPEDNLYQQMIPTQAWGQRYLTIPTSVDEKITEFNPNIFKVAVKDPTTIVKRNGVQLTGMVNQTYEFNSSTPDYIEADKPILISQSIPSLNACGYRGLGDPDLAYISPIEQGIKQIGFFRNKDEDIAWNFLSLTIPDAGLASLTVDGAKDYSVMPHPNMPGYSVVVQRWRSTWAYGQCQVKSDSAFTAVTYGLGNAESYMYNAGAFIKNLSGSPYIKNTYNNSDTASLFTCGATPFKMVIRLRYQPTKLVVRPGAIGNMIQPAAEIVLNNPVADGQEMVMGVPYYVYTLPATYTVSKEGKYNIPVYATHQSIDGCDHTEKIPFEIEVRKELKTGFDIGYESCSRDQVIALKADPSFTDGSPVKQWEWTVTGAGNTWTSTQQNFSQQIGTGEYDIRLLAIDEHACIADTSKKIETGKGPEAPVIAVTSADKCVSASIQFSEAQTAAGAQQWYWDFGDGTILKPEKDGQSVTHVYAQPGTYTVKHAFAFSATCSSDTASTTITIYGKPAVAPAFDGGCVQADGKLAFTGNATAPAGATIQTHSWNFGDAAATPANPNTAAVENPTHNYAQGSYQVSYSVQTNQGCSADTLFTVTVNLKPVLQYPDPIREAVCAGPGNPLSVASASVTNNVPGTGVYQGPGVEPDGSFDPNKAGAGRHTIKYFFTSTAGCIDSIESHITVKPVPTAGFTASTEKCVGEAIRFTNTSSVDNGGQAGASIVRWTWNFGDGKPAQTKTNGDAFDYLYETPGSYTVTLTVETSEGCTSLPYSQTVTLHAIPTAAFDLPAVVCMPGGQALFTNRSAITDGSALGYAWTFSDGQTSTDKDPVVNFTTAADYQVVLTVRSAGGCSATLQQTLPASAFKNKPVAAFEFSPARICQGSPVTFTDKSTVAGGQLSQWNWSFGDGTSSTDQHPVKTYSGFGNFTATLQVGSSDGCLSDPLPASSKTITVLVQPVIDAGPDQNAKEGSTVVLAATAQSENQLRFNWTPAQLLSDAHVLRPSYMVVQDQLFYLTATDQQGECSARDSVWVKILRTVNPPNVFSPNGDGIHDTWVIPYLADYKDSKLEVFNRYGQLVFSSTGYPKPWDGRMNGNPLPAGTYYYIIQLNNGMGKLSGSVTIIR